VFALEYIKIILSYFCPIFVLSKYFEPIRSKFCPYFVPNVCPTFVLFLSYFCPSGFEIFLFCPSILYKMFRICIFCPIFVLLLSLCSKFFVPILSYFCPYFCRKFPPVHTAYYYYYYYYYYNYYYLLPA
jgi:hypothetical protein